MSRLAFILFATDRLNNNKIQLAMIILERIYQNIQFSIGRYVSWPFKNVENTRKECVD